MRPRLDYMIGWYNMNVTYKSPRFGPSTPIPSAECKASGDLAPELKSAPCRQAFTSPTQSISHAAAALCTVNRIFLLVSCCFRGSGATTVFGTGIGLMFAASARSVAIALIGNFVLRVSSASERSVRCELTCT